MKEADVKKLIKEAEVKEQVIIEGSDEDGKPIVTDKHSGIFEVNLGKKANQTVSIEAKDETEARKKVEDYIIKTDNNLLPPGLQTENR